MNDVEQRHGKDRIDITYLFSSVLKTKPPFRNQKLKCSLPIDMDTVGLQRISKNQTNWQWTMKADGERAWLVIGPRMKQPALLFRNMEQLTVSGTAVQALIANLKPGTWSIFDGELLRESQTFLIFDCLMMDSQNLTQSSFQNRFNFLSGIKCAHLETRMTPTSDESKTADIRVASSSSSSLSSSSSSSPLDESPTSRANAFSIYVKPTFSLSVLTTYLRPMQLRTPSGLNIACDGIIFMQNEGSNYFQSFGSSGASSANAFMLKWKYLPTVDLLLKKDNKLYCTGFKEKLKCMGSVLLETHEAYNCNSDDIKESKLVTDGDISPSRERSNLDFIIKHDDDGVVVECKLVPQGSVVAHNNHVWQILKVRKDKKHPNHEKIVCDTIKVLQDNITFEKLQSYLSSDYYEIGANDNDIGNDNDNDIDIAKVKENPQNNGRNDCYKRRRTH